ncbi:MAG: hypothetical protein L3J37_00285 [Rhodobacteraceae bacterium]|nr:hypothetical protein [Paracoccaceae bacterium]
MSDQKHHPKHMMRKMANITASIDAYDIHQETMERLRGHIDTLDMLVRAHPVLIEPTPEARMLLATLSAVSSEAAQLDSSGEALLALAAKREVTHV